MWVFQIFSTILERKNCFVDTDVGVGLDAGTPITSDTSKRVDDVAICVRLPITYIFSILAATK